MYNSIVRLNTPDNLSCTAVRLADREFYLRKRVATRQQSNGKLDYAKCIMIAYKGVLRRN